MVHPQTHGTSIALTLLIGAMTLTGLTGCGGDKPQPEATAAKPASTPASQPAASQTAAPKQANVAVPQQPQKDPALPPLIANPSKVNFGIVEPGSKLNADVTLLNPTNRPIRIVKAQPSCTCTTVNMDNVVIPARGTVQMPISMTTNRSVGKKPARVQLLVAGYSKFFTVDIDAENAWAVRSVPPHISINDKTDLIERRTGRYSLQSLDRKPFRVLSVLGEEPNFEGFNPNTDSPRNSYVLNYDFTGLACEDLPPFLIIRTDHPKAEMLDIRVRHNPCTRISPTLPMADFRSNLGVVKPGETIEVPLSFKKLQNQSITSVQSTDPLISTTLVDQTQDGFDTNTITIAQISPNAPEGLFQIPVLYSTGQKTAEHLFYGWVEK